MKIRPDDRGDWTVGPWLVVMALVLVAWTTPAKAQTTNWNVAGSGDWNTAGNWTNGIPGSEYMVNITESDSIALTITYDYPGPTVTLANLSIDQTGSGSITVSQSTNSLAVDEGGEYVGANSNYVQTGGTNTITDGGSLTVNGSGPDPGTYMLGGSSILSISNAETCGQFGTATFNQQGGTNTATGPLNIANYGGSVGTYSINAGSANFGAVFVGGSSSGVGGTGSLNISGSGSIIATSITTYGAGSINLSGGTTSTSALNLNGTLTQTGGTNSISGAGSLNIGASSGSTGTYNLSGGILSASNVYVGGTSSGAGGQGTLLISGSGSLTASSITVYGNAEILTDGGSISASSLTVDGGFNYAGGNHSLGAISIGSGGDLDGNNTFTLGSTETLAVLNGSKVNPANFVTTLGSFMFQQPNSTISASSLTIGGAFNVNGGGTITANSMTVEPGGNVNDNSGSVFSVPVLNVYGTFSGAVSPSVLNIGGVFIDNQTAASQTTFIQSGGDFDWDASGGVNNGVIDMTAGGAITSGSSGVSMTNGATGQIVGAGTISIAVTNNGTVEPTTGLMVFTGAFSNTGTIIVPSGSSGVGEALFDNFTSNSGVISLSGGTFNTNSQALSNTSQIAGFGIIETGGLTNSGTLALSGQSSVYGSVTNSSNGTIHLSGNSPNVFYGTVSNSGTLTVDAGASGTFYGAYTGSGKIIDNGSLYLNANSVAGPISGNGNLTIGSTSSGPAVVQIVANSGLSTLASLSLNSGSTLDIANNLITINYGNGLDPISSIAAWIKSGYNGGTWNGTGIISTNAQTNPNYGIGYADSADPGNPANLASGTIEILYTLFGDANLDGKVNGIDFNLLATNFNQAVTNGWDKGDFNYDGKVNGNDFVLLADNFNQFASQSAVSTADWTALQNFAAANGISLANVPEPACTGIIVMAGLGILRRRQQSSPHVKLVRLA